VTRTTTTAERGRQAEKLARAWLEQKGLTHHASNWSCRLGEIDLVMQDGDTLVFVEVRFRNSRSFGGALASVTPQKQRRVQAAAGIWLSRQKHANPACRFDVLGMEPDDRNGIQYQWIQHAFMGDFT
jgi:putative endonuclease